MINVYGIPGSPFLASVLWLLEERRAPYTMHMMGPKDSKSAEHLLRHPFGRIPSIEHDGFRLYETQAILRFVAETFPGEPLQPDTARDRARMNQVIGIVDWYLFPNVAATLVFEHVIKPVVLKLPPDIERARSKLAVAHTCLAELEQLMDGRQYIAGDTVSLADLHLAPQLYYIAMTDDGREILQQHPHLSAWLARMTARPAMAKTLLIGLDRPSA